MKMKDIVNVHMEIRKKYSPDELSPEILSNIIDELFKYLDSNNQPERLNEKTYYRNEDGIYPYLEPVIGCDSLTSTNK